MNKTMIQILILLACLGAGVLAGTVGRQAIAGSSQPDPVVQGDFAEVLAGQQHEVVLFATPTCPFCKQAREYLSAQGIAYTEHDVTQPAEAARFRELDGQGVPVLFTSGTRITGFNEAAYRAALNGSAARG